MPEKLKSSLEKKEKKFSPFLNLAVGLTLFFTGFLGSIKETSAEFNEQQVKVCDQLPSRDTNETLSSYSKKTGFVESLARTPPSLEKTIKLNSENKEEIFKDLEEFVNSNFYINYPLVYSKGEVNIHPSMNILLPRLKDLVVKGFKGKLVNDTNYSEINLREIIVSANIFADKTSPIIKGFLEFKKVDPHVIIKLGFENNKEKLRPKTMVYLEGFSKIEIKDLNRRGSGKFNDREFYEATEEAINNIFLYVQRLQSEKSFLELTESLRKPLFPIKSIILDTHSKQPAIYYSIEIDQKYSNYFKSDDEVCVYLNINSENILLEKTNLKPLFFDDNHGFIFIKSNKFNELTSLQKSIQEIIKKDFKKKVEIKPDDIPGLLYIVKENEVN